MTARCLYPIGYEDTPLTGNLNYGLNLRHESCSIHNEKDNLASIRGESSALKLVYNLL